MKRKTLRTPLLAIIALITGQISFGMEQKIIQIPVTYTTPASEIWKKSFNTNIIRSAAFNPDNKDEFFLIFPQAHQVYTIKSKDPTEKELNQNTINEIINKNSQYLPCSEAYTLSYNNKSTGLIRDLGNEVTLSDTATNTPLYTIKHEPIINTTTTNSITPKETTVINNYIKFAIFNADQTKLMTVSDNEVKISEIKKPITITYNDTSIVCNHDIACTSQMIDNFCDSQTQSDRASFQSLAPLGHMLPLMALVYKNETDQINKLLNNLNVYALCDLALPCNYFRITNKDTNLTDIICAMIAKKYRPKTDQSYIKTLPLDCENLIARHRVKDCITYKDSIELDGRVFTASFNRNGTQVVIVHNNIRNIYEATKIWNTATGVCSYTLDDGNNEVLAVAFNHYNTLLASATACKITIWNATTGTRSCTLNGDIGYVNTIAFNHNDTQLASGSGDGKITIWNTITGKCIYSFDGHDKNISSIAFNHDSTLLASGSWDNTIKIWNVTTGECICSLDGHKKSVYPVAFNHDSTLLASGSWDNIIKIWNVTTGECICSFDEHKGPVYSVAFNHDGTLLASGSDDKTIKIWDTKTWRCLHTLNGHLDTIFSVTFNSDSTRVISISDDKSVKTWDINSKERQTFLDQLTIEQADFLVENTYPLMQQNKKLEIVENSKDYATFTTILSQEAQKYLKDHITVKAALSNVALPSNNSYDKESHQRSREREAGRQLSEMLDNAKVKFETEKLTQKTQTTQGPLQQDAKKQQNSEAHVGAQGLPYFFDKPFINKNVLWTGLSIGTFTTIVAVLFLYYTYFKALAS